MRFLDWLFKPRRDETYDRMLDMLSVETTRRENAHKSEVENLKQKYDAEIERLSATIEKKDELIAKLLENLEVYTKDRPQEPIQDTPQNMPDSHLTREAQIIARAMLNRNQALRMQQLQYAQMQRTNQESREVQSEYDAMQNGSYSELHRRVMEQAEKNGKGNPTEN